MFLDDNPVERAQIKAAHPHVRVIEAPHLDWRRILLWSPETQVETITEESSKRNEMVRAQVVREGDRATMSHADFLRSLEVRVEIEHIVESTDGQFVRALELINKTNQFNTTGKRWTEAEATAFLANGGQWVVFKVSDRYTHYGLVGVLALLENKIVQCVMSCRVFGLGVEHAVLARLSQQASLVGRIVETPKNGPCRLVFQEAGWQFDGEVWRSPENACGIPAQVSVA